MTLDEICHSFEPEGVLIGKCRMKRIALAAVLLAAMASPTVSKPSLTVTSEGLAGPSFECNSARHTALRNHSPCPVAVPSLASAAPAAGRETVNGLRQAGWVVVEKRGRIERRPGLPPYETMDRAVHITTFVMEKGGQRKVCTLAYDSQLDTLDEECRDAK